MSARRWSEVARITPVTLAEAVDDLNRQHGLRDRADFDQIDLTLAELEQAAPESYALIEQHVNRHARGREMDGVQQLLQESTPAAVADNGGPHVPTFAV